MTNHYLSYCRSEYQDTLTEVRIINICDIAVLTQSPIGLKCSQIDSYHSQYIYMYIYDKYNESGCHIPQLNFKVEDFLEKNTKNEDLTGLIKSNIHVVYTIRF